MVRPLLTAILLLPLCAGAAPPAGPAPVAEVVRQVAVAYGGEAAWARGAAGRQPATLHPRIRHPGKSGRLERLFTGDGRLRVEITYAGGEREQRLLANGRGWRDGREVAGPMRTAMAVQAARLILPTLLARHASEVVDGGTVATEAGILHLLSLPMGGALMEAAIDPTSGHIVRTTGRIPMGPMALTFTTDYSDFRRVEGLLFPFHEENWAQGSHTATTVVEQVELLDKLNPEDFRPAPPEAGRPL